MIRLLWLVVLLAVPLAGATADIPAELVISTRIDLADFAEVGAPTPVAAGEEPTHTCQDIERSDLDPFNPETPTSRSHLVHVRPANISTLSFQEAADEVGCAEARFEILLPEHGGLATQADSFVLRFAADRHVGRAAGNSGTRVEQGVVFYIIDEGQDIDDPTLVPLECFGRVPTFADTIPSVSPVERIELKIEFSRCDDELEGRRIVVAFYFRDASTREQIGMMPMPSGQQFSARVSDVTITFEGAQLPVGLRVRDGSDPEQQLLGYLEATVEIPEAIEGHEHEVSFPVDNAWGIHALYKVSDGEPRPVAADLFRAREDQGTLHFTLTNELLEAEGCGTYMVLFSGAATGQVKASRIPFVLLALVAPLVAGLVAQRNLNHLYRSARGRVSAQRTVLQGALLGAWVAYVGVAITLVASSSGIGMAAWPLPLANLLAYVILGLVSLAMVMVGIISRRREMALVLDDLSELERIQTELERSNRELEQFAYVASHDLKEPLRMVAGYTQLLEMRYGKKLDEKGKEFLGFATEGAKRLQHMVDDLLAYSRVRTDHATFKQVDLRLVMVIVEGHLRAMLKERGVRLEYGRLVKLHADQGQLVQLMMNLVQNAVKFSPQDNPVVEVTAERAGEGYRICVRDEGIGIEAKQQDRIFHIFQRLHLREAYDGNGIGLAVCKKIVEQWGGDIGVESAPGKGSTFTINLPDLRPRPARPTKVSGAARASRSADSPA